MRLLWLVLLAGLAWAETTCEPSERDCADVCFGPRAFDDVGACCLPDEKDCAGHCWGLQELDACGLCGGNNTHMDADGSCCEPSEMDCNRICHGAGVPDACGVCDGGNAGMDLNGTCCAPHHIDCTGYCNGPYHEDACGICGGDGSTCCGVGGACSRHGVCSGLWKQCVCAAGWTGHECQISMGTCANVDCGPNGVCDEATGACACASGYVGATCKESLCGVYGAYDVERGACHCYAPFSGPDCEECAPVAHNQTLVRVCFRLGTEGLWMPRTVPRTGLLVRYGGVTDLWKRTNGTMFEAGALVNDTKYDMCCRALEVLAAEDAADAGGEARSVAVRYSLPESQAALNAFLIQSVDYTITTDQELQDLVTATIEENQRKEGLANTVAMLCVIAVSVLLVTAMAMAAAIAMLLSMKPKLI